MQAIKSYYAAAFLFFTGLMFGQNVLAQAAPNPYATDLSSLTSSINWTTVITAVLAVAVSLMGLYAVIKGVKIVVSMIRR